MQFYCISHDWCIITTLWMCHSCYHRGCKVLKVGKFLVPLYIGLPYDRVAIWLCGWPLFLPWFYVHIHTYAHICIDTHATAKTHTHTTQICTFEHACACLCAISACAHIYTCMCVHIYIAMHICVHLICHVRPIYSSMVTMHLPFPSPSVHRYRCPCTTHSI